MAAAMTDTPIPNIPLLRKAVEWAEAEAAKPDRERLWDQAVYANETDCGTSYCIAGYAVTLALPGASVDKWGDLRVDGVLRQWRDAGIEVLGLTVSESYALFDPINTIGQVRRAAEQIAARAGERL